MSLFIKTPHPVLTPQAELPWADGAVFNPGAWCTDGTIHLLFRAVPKGYRRITLPDPQPGEPTTGYDNYISYIGYASSTDGVHFTCREAPFLAPDADFDRFGTEDPRISRLDEDYLITYTALSHPAFGSVDGVRIGLATTRDFQTVHKHHPIGPPMCDKDAVIFPRRIGGRIAMLHRFVPDIQLIYFDSLAQLLSPPERLWREHLASLDEHVVMRPEAAWEQKKIGAGPTPIETSEGWLLLYHGVDMHYVYRAGMALLDLEDPQRVLARTRLPVLEPEAAYEQGGDVNNVVFPEGAVVIDGQLHVYYGAADSVVGHARAPLEDVLDVLRDEGTQWRPPRIYFHAARTGDRLRSIATPSPVKAERLHGGRPILEPEPVHAWESRVVFNPAAVLVETGPSLEALFDAWQLAETDRTRLREAGGACVMLYRAQGEPAPGTRHAPSSLGLAVFTPTLGLVRRWAEPVIAPLTPFHDLGVEDPRCLRIGDVYYLYYTGYTSERPLHSSFLGRVHICLATSRDFLHWELHGPLRGDLNSVYNKNAAPFPEPVQGKWLLMHRPIYGRHPMAVHLAAADHPDGPFHSQGLLMASYRYQEFSLSWVGAAGPPLALGDDRFLIIYHQGHLDWHRGREYDLSAALVDFNASPPVRARLEPLMRPEGVLERSGDALLGVDNVLFSCANYRLGDDVVIPYAGADSRIFGARLPLQALVQALEAESRKA